VVTTPRAAGRGAKVFKDMIDGTLAVAA
jgi:hypothetical protein